MDPASASTAVKIELYGINWKRSKVNWTARRILGYDTDPLEGIDFSNQQDVYVLYDWNSVVYVGQTNRSNGGLLRGCNITIGSRMGRVLVVRDSPSK